MLCRSMYERMVVEVRIERGLYMSGYTKEGICSRVCEMIYEKGPDGALLSFG